MSTHSIWRNSPMLRLGLAMAFGLALLLGLLLAMGAAHPPEVALALAPMIRYVDGVTGDDSGNDCITNTTPCATVQHAVDVAAPGDEIRVATGVYTGVQARAGVTQVVYISRTVIVRGGYTTTDWGTSNPISYPTTLDAQGKGRVLYITGEISPIVEGLRITGGDVEGNGGGVYNQDADLTLINTIITNNISSGTIWSDGLGGGVYVDTGSVTLSKGQVISNSASYKGGGVCIWSGSATLSGGQIINNTANGPTGWDGGGGVYVGAGSVTLSGGQIIGNSAGQGGGVYVYQGNATLSGGQILDNSAIWGGGGVFIWTGGVTLSGGQIISNSASYGGGVYAAFSSATFIQTSVSTIAHNSASGKGGGVFVEYGRATLSGGQIIGNSASHGGGVYVDHISATVTLTNVSTIARNSANYGGGIYIKDSPAVIQGNVISANHAITSGGGIYLTGNTTAQVLSNQILSNTASSAGGGLFLSSSDATLINNVVADNQANSTGSGLYIEGSSPRLLHTTIARNGGSGGSGVYVAGTNSTVALTNTILVSYTVGITVTAGNTATLEATLWGTDTWANLADWGGAGSIFTGTINLWDNPAFTDPDAGDYHISPGSAAVDAGVNAGVNVDSDGEPRPAGAGYDIGADEYYHPALTVTKQANPDPVQAGSPLTYTLRVTNTGNVTLTATITDILPEHVTPVGFLTWTPITITAPGGVWTQQAVVTAKTGYSGTLTNVVEVTADQGATDVYTETSIVVEYSIYLPVVLKNLPGM